MIVIKKYILNKITIIFIITLCIIFFTAKTFNNAFKEFEEIVVSSSGEIKKVNNSDYNFKSLRATKTNVRLGPSLEHSIIWTYNKRSIPIEILEDVDGWSKIRDFDANIGWIKNTLISSNRTGIIAPWEVNKEIDIYHDLYNTKDSLKVKTKLEPGVIVSIIQCDGIICNVSADDRTGWISQELIYGVYRGEEIYSAE
jgi:SH3-like domain-containing protein